MPSVTQQLAARGLIRPPGFLPTNVMYETLMGSVAYGVSTDHSDRDLYGCCIPPKDEIFPHLAGEIPGFGELFRVLSFETIGTSPLQSRCLAGVANGTVVFVLPGSLDAVQTAWDRLIRAQLDATTRPCNLVQLLPRLREPAG